MAISNKLRALVNADRAYKHANQQTLGQLSLPAGAPKHAKDLAQARPWTGQEPVGDQVHRMLQDSHKVPGRRERLGLARENAIDYKYNPGKNYGERVQAPRQTSSGISTGGSIDSIANQNIEDAIARGQFKDLPRGKRIDPRTYKLENPYIDTTELILNRMIQRQGAAPPWILKQKAMHREIAAFRETTTKQILTMMVHELDAGREALYGSECSVAWRKQQGEYHRVAIEELNNMVRGYNLQAPQSARKGYLFVETEIEGCFEAAAARAPEALDVFRGKKQVPKAEGLHRARRGEEDSSKHYGLLEMLGWRQRGRDAH